MSKSILVPLDGSTFSEHALPAALGIARASGARVHLVQVHEVPFMPLAPEAVVPWDAAWDDTLRAQEHEYLRTMAGRVAEAAGVTVRTELLEGNVETALAGYAQEAGIDLIVMTTHGRGGLSRWWLGSVADAVVRRSQLPVLLMRPAEGEADLQAEFLPRHVLVPLDGSELSRGILEPATWIGSLSGARYTLLSVTLSVPVARPPFIFPEAWTDRTALEAEQTRTEEELRQASEALRADGYEVEAVVEQHMTPAHAILAHSATHAVDLIAIATHGRGGWSRFALGSVADKVLRGAVMPVLVFRPPAHGRGDEMTRERGEPNALRA